MTPPTPSLETLFAPAEFQALATRNLEGTLCVVFDVLRATSSMVTALAAGAKSIYPVSTIEEALTAKSNNPGVLLAGERDGRRIQGNRTGGLDFDLGNSPREFTADRVAGRDLVMTTTNGTRALQACARADTVLVSSFLNLDATARGMAKLTFRGLIVVCGGTFEEAAYEDSLAAGALLDLVWDRFATGHIADSALMARALFRQVRKDLPAALAQARNGRRLLSRPDLADDVAFCAQLDRYDLLARMGPDGRVSSNLQP